MKKKILILSIAILVLTFCMAACRKPAQVVTASSIEVVAGSVITECNVGDTPDFSGIKVKVTYSDSTTKEIGYADVQLSTIDTSSAGDKTVTVTYGELSTTFKVTVKEVEAPPATLTSIKIVNGTVPSALYIGQSFDASGLQVEAFYSDNTKKILTLEQVQASTIDATTAGDKTFTVTYEGKTDSITVKVYDIISIKVVSGTIASKLFVGETLNTANVEVIVAYGDGTSKIVSASELTVGTLDTTTHGYKKVDVTYNGITIQYDVEVVGEVSITVLAGSVPASVKVGGVYDASQIKATLTYSGNSTDPKELTAADLTVSAIDTTTAGDKTLTVSYNGLVTTVTVKVVGVETLTVITNSVSNEILKGAAFDTSKISVSVKYTDGTTDVVGAAALTLGTINVNQAGEQKLTITHLDKTIEHTVKVCEVTSIRVSGVANSVQSGKAIDVSGMKVYGVYNDSKNTTVELKDGITTNVAELNTTHINSTEARTLTVSYNGAYGEFTTSLTIFATAPELTGIEIRNYNTEVLLNNAYDKTSIVVYATYGNGTSARVTGFTMTDVATGVAGNVTFTVTYEGKTVTATVKVCQITSLDIVGVPLFVPSGEPIDLTGMKVYGIYNNTAKTRVELTDGTITTNLEELNTTYLDSTEPRVLTVSYVGMYGEFSTTYTIDTTAPVLEEIIIQNHTAEVKLGETYGKSDVQVVAVYGNGQRVTLSADAFSMTSVSTTVGGNVTFTVSYTDGGVTKTAQATVKVCTITSLEIEGVASTVQSGNPVVITGMKVYGVYNNTAETRVELTSGFTTNIDALNANVNGTTNRVLVVTYENGATGSFEISVTAPALVGIEIVGYNTSIGIGGAYDKNSVLVEAIYGNGTRAPLAEGFTVSDVYTGTVGEVNLTVTYQGVTSPAVKVNVLGIASIQVSGIPTLVYKGTALNTDGVQVTVTFTDGSTRVVGKADGVEVSAPDTTTGGDKTLAVSYLGTSAVFTYHVKAVEKIEIYSGLTYIIRTGHTVSFDNLKILVTYTNGTSEVIGKTYAVDCKLEGNRVTITYEGCVATRDLVEATLYQVHALNGTIPGSILAGNQLNYSDFRITLVYRWYVEKIGDDGQPVVDPETGKVVMVEKEELVLVGLNEPGLYTLQFTEYVDYTPLGLLYGLNPYIDTSTAGERLFQVVYLPTGTAADYTTADTGVAGIPLYQAQAKIIVIDVAGITIVPGSVPSNVKLNGEYDVSGIQVQVTYTDGTYKYVSLSDLKSVSTPNTSAAGTQTLTVIYQGPTGEHTDTYEVTVVDTGASVDGMIFGAMLPDSLIARDTYKNNFKDNDNIYVVGDDNPYELYLNVAVLDSNNKLIDVNGKDVATVVQIFEITGGQNTLLEGEALSAVVSFPAMNKYQFTPAAVGRSFRLEIRPAANYVGTDAAKHEIKVVDGYNIYDEKELNLLTNSYGDWTCEDLNENISSLGRSDQGEAAAKFLLANGITTAPESINAVILHRNMTIEVEDLPPEYFHTYTKDGVTKTEFIDHLEVYHRLVPTNQPFYFYGNYYSVFSYNLPCVVPKSVWNNVDEYSNSTLFCFRFDIRDYWALAGRTDYDQIEYPDSKQVAYVVDAGFRDNDPNSNDQSASERHMRGLTCFTNKAVTTNITNVNVEAFVVALRPEGSNCTVNLDQVKFYNCWQGQIFVWNDNGFQLDNWPSLGGNVKEMTTLPGRFGSKINITDSLLAKCGGPVILAQSYMANKAANNELSIDVVVDDKSVLYSYVTGQEAWFVAVNQTPMAAQIMALDQLVSGTAAAQHINASYLSDQKIQGVKTMNMVMVVMGAGVTPGEEYSGSFTKGGEVKMQMIKDASVNNPHPENGPYTYPWFYDRYMSDPMSSQAPIFTTSAGGHLFAVPFDVKHPETGATLMPQGAYSVDFFGTQQPGPASGNCFKGDYITMHMYGMGIMLEYYTD